MIIKAVRAAWLATTQARSWLTLLAVATAAAALYAWGAAARLDRDRMIAWGDRVCASAGAELAPPKGKRGSDCAGRIARLAAFQRDTQIQTAQLLAKALADQQRQSSADAQRSRAAAADARAAAVMMENANAQIGPDNRVGSDWFAALNRAGGLRVAER